MFEFGPYLAIKSQERLSNPQNTVQYDSWKEISLAKVSLEIGKF